MLGIITLSPWSSFRILFRDVSGSLDHPSCRLYKKPLGLRASSTTPSLKLQADHHTVPAKTSSHIKQPARPFKCFLRRFVLPLRPRPPSFWYSAHLYMFCHSVRCLTCQDMFFLNAAIFPGAPSPPHTPRAPSSNTQHNARVRDSNVAHGNIQDLDATSENLLCKQCQITVNMVSVQVRSSWSGPHDIQPKEIRP